MGRPISHDTAEIMALGNSVLYDPGDGGNLLAMPKKCAEHPGGIDGWLDAVFQRRDEMRRNLLIAKLRSAHRLEREVSETGTAKYSLEQVSELSGLPDQMMGTIAAIRRSSDRAMPNRRAENPSAYRGAIAPWSYGELLHKLQHGADLDELSGSEQDRPEPDAPLEVEEVARKRSTNRKSMRERQKVADRIDDALAYQGRCPSCGREPVYIFDERAYCSQAERDPAHREMHGWDVHTVSSSERRRIKEDMAHWQRRVEPINLDKVYRGLENTPQAPPKEAVMAPEIDIDSLPPMQLHTEIERSCRECGCTKDDCSECIARTGEPCTWVEEDLCSACTTLAPVIEETPVELVPYEPIVTPFPASGRCMPCDVWCPDLGDHIRANHHSSPDLDLSTRPPEVETSGELVIDEETRARLIELLRSGYTTSHSRFRDLSETQKKELSKAAEFRGRSRRK